MEHVSANCLHLIYSIMYWKMDKLKVKNYIFHYAVFVCVKYIILIDTLGVFMTPDVICAGWMRVKV